VFLLVRYLSFASLFSTHPSTQDRIKRLEELKNEIYGKISQKEEYSKTIEDFFKDN